MTMMLDPAGAARVRRRPVPSLPPTEELLVAGGDARLDIDPSSGTNRYFCSPSPVAALAAFGSATASIVSPTGFAAADRLRRRLLGAAEREVPSLTYAGELDRLRRELAELCGLSDLSGLTMVFAASGTDLHLFAARLAGTGPAPRAIAPLAIMVEAAETGSGVPAALAGRHFSTTTAFGHKVVSGTAIDGTPPDVAPMDVVAVASRDADGRLRPASLVDAEIASLAGNAAAAGRRVLVTLVDVSKTGLIAPSPAAALALRDRLPGRVELLVDACQFRLAPATLRAYLERGCMVALTGSKFVTGPAFSGVLLIPAALTERFRDIPLSPGFAHYSSRAEWPLGWAAGQSLGDAANYGLLLRWEAALAELRAFRRIAAPATDAFLGAFAQAVQARLASDPAFEPLESRPLERGLDASPAGWDRHPTIFPFLLRGRRVGGGTVPLDRAQTEGVYRALAINAAAALDRIGDPARIVAALRCQLGQPVPCGRSAGIELSALRLCASARLVVEAESQGAGAVIRRAMAALDKVALLARLQTAQ